ncbi:MAG: hypothetical protein HY430_02710 [Candidatus Levybacteria bacterium]|nr:hypothetical protein [Candidatus Levybacteria bacterium]
MSAQIAETGRQHLIYTIFPDQATDFVGITPLFTDQTNNIVGISFVPGSEAGTPTVHMEYGFNDDNEIVAYRLRVSEETLIYQRRETQSGVPYGVFYGFDHPFGDEGSFELEISFGPAVAGKFEDPEDAFGGVRYFADPPAIKEVIAGKVFAPDSDRESNVFLIGREDPAIEVQPMQWKSKLLPGKSEKGWLYLAKNEGTALSFRLQDPHTLVIKTIVVPFEFDREKVAQVAFSETEFDQETGMASAQWRQLESILNVQLEYFNANYSLSEYRNPIPNQDIVIKITNKPPDPEVAPPSDTLIKEEST